MTAARLVTRLLTLTKCPTLHLGTKGTPTLRHVGDAHARMPHTHAAAFSRTARVTPPRYIYIRGT